MNMLKDQLQLNGKMGIVNVIQFILTQCLHIIDRQFRNYKTYIFSMNGIRRPTKFYFQVIIEKI